MKPVISLTDNSHQPTIYILNKLNKISINDNQETINHPPIPKYIPSEFQKIYTKIYNNISNKSTIIINNYLTPSSKYIFETMKESLKNQGLKFSSFDITSKNKIPLTNIISIINKLNPSTSLLQLILIVIQYIIMLTIDYLKNNNFINRNKSNLIYNPSNISINNNDLLKNSKLINKPTNYQKFNKYSKIIFIYDKYNPYNYVEYIKTKNYCFLNKIPIHIIKN